MRPRRRNVVPYGFSIAQPERPAPTYPEYEQLLADAEESAARDGGMVDPRKWNRLKMLQRSWEWRVCVLGHDDENRSVLEMHMLLLADERDLNPPVPQWLLDVRAEGERRDAEKRAAREAYEQRDAEEWEKIRAQCAVDVVVCRNGTARVRGNHLHHLGHVVPVADALSGPDGRPRRHPAGRAVCETERRARPLDLSGGKGGPATCVNCLKITPHLRPAGDPR